MQGTTCQSLELIESVEDERVFVFRFGRHVVQFPVVVISDAERKHLDAILSKLLRRWSWVATVRVSIRYKEDGLFGVGARVLQHSLQRPKRLG